MRRGVLAVAAALSLAMASFVVPLPPVARADVINVPTDDAEMNAAIASARASIASFWTAYDAPPVDGIDGFSLKVRIKEGDKSEHFWLTDIKRAGDTFEGTISNDPEIVTTVTGGQRYGFPEGDITDWLFRRNGKIVGNQTMRPLLKRMPPEDAERFRAMLETP